MTDIFYWDKQLTKNKSLSIQLSYYKWWNFFEIQIRWPMEQDHGGPYFNLTIFGLDLIINLYDKRHWNDETNDWEVYEK